MTLSIVGTGLVSPFGRSPREHVFFLRAHVPSPFTPPFTRRDQKPVRVHFCPWLDAGLPPAARLTALATTALDGALSSLREARLPAPILALCLARPRPGLDAEVHAAVAEALRLRLSPASIETCWGEAGCFAALQMAEREVRRNPGALVAIVAADSHVSAEWLADRVERPPTRWETRKPTPSEAAAALVVASSQLVAQHRLPTFGAIQRSAIATGAANDDNDEVADALGMGAVLRELGTGHVPHAFGQGEVDALRREEWYRAVARQSARFWECSHVCLEADIGAVGAAAGLANLVFGGATFRHGVGAPPASGPVLAWALSRDGTRGAASFTVEGP